MHAAELPRQQFLLRPPPSRRRWQQRNDGRFGGGFGGGFGDKGGGKGGKPDAANAESEQLAAQLLIPLLQFQIQDTTGHNQGSKATLDMRNRRVNSCELLIIVSLPSLNFSFQQ